MDFTSGLKPKAPKVKMTSEAMQAGHATAQHPAMRPAMEQATNQHQQVGAEEPESKRTVLQPTDNPATNQALATAEMPAFRAKLEQALQGIPGAQLVAIRDAKNPQRMAEKINTEGQPAETLSDYGAAQVSVDSPAAKDAVIAAVKKAFPIVREKDNFGKGDDDYHFHAVILQVQMPTHGTMELQVIPKEVMDANPDQHQNYKAARDAEISGNEQESERQKEASRTKNDNAMAAFSARNSVGKSKTGEGGSGQSPEQAAGATGVLSPATLKTGSNVRLKDGTRAKVAYAPPSKAQIQVYRLKTDDGKQQHLRGREIGGVHVLPDEWIGVDIDKTLAHFTTFKGATTIGKPVPEMVGRVKQWLKEGEDVRIFTARVANDPTGAARKAVEEWCVKYIGMKLPITNVKDDKMKLLFDDRARQVEENTGKVVGDDSTEAKGDLRESGATPSGRQEANPAPSRPSSGTGQSVGNWPAGLMARA